VDGHRRSGSPAAACLRGQEATGHLSPSRDRLRVRLAALVLMLPSAAAVGDPLAGAASPANLLCPPPLFPVNGGGRHLSGLSVSRGVSMTGGPG
jgi:hypothetical protein